MRSVFMLEKQAPPTSPMLKVIVIYMFYNGLTKTVKCLRDRDEPYRRHSRWTLDSSNYFELCQMRVKQMFPCWKRK